MSKARRRRGKARRRAAPAMRPHRGCPDEPGRHRPRLRARPAEDGDRPARRGLPRGGVARRTAALHEALPLDHGRRLPRVDRARMAHPGAAGRPRRRLRARRGAVRPRRGWRYGAGADLRRRHHRRPVGDAAAGAARRPGAGACLCRPRPLVGAGAPQPDRARSDPPAGGDPSRHQGRQRLHSLRPAAFPARGSPGRSCSRCSSGWR